MMRIAHLAILILCTSCWFFTDYKEGPFISPDRTHEVSAFVNRTDKSKPNYAKVVLTVLDKTNEKKIEIATGIGSVMKWAIGWYKEDIIVAQSSDIGPRSWKIVKGGYKELEVTAEMDQFAEQLRKEKYHLR